MGMKINDVIQWHCEDSDDNTTWKKTGLVTSKGVVYLGGGVDFGTAIGKVIPIEQVKEEARCNDPGMNEIKIVSTASRLADYISKLG